MTKLFASLLFLSITLPQGTADRPLPFSDTQWEKDGERTTIVQDGGREVLQMETGSAVRRDVRLENGTIDFDVQVTRRRSFVYLFFRMQSDDEREEVYLRPHKSGLPDSLQYAPVWQGRSAWQLHHGPGGTAAISFEPGAWTHVRLVLEGRRAALFVGEMAKPALLVPQLAREPREGYIGFGGSLPAGVPGSGPIAKFSNVVVRPGTSDFNFDQAVSTAGMANPPAPTAGIVRTWNVSSAFVPRESEQPSIPAAEVLGTFQRLETEPGGLLELHRYVRMPEKSNVAAAVARIRVRASEARIYAFDLGFSDIATVFLNGKPLFRGEAGYSFDRPRREGLIGFDQARLYLPLQAGDNDLSILVSDSFGGWGLMGRFPSTEGLTLEGR